MVELTNAEYQLFKQDHCEHEVPKDEHQCYCCGGFHLYRCAKCDKQLDTPCPPHDDPDNDDAPYCRNCI